MVWSRIKIRGFHPSPRAGSCGVLCGTKWYITGGGSRKKSKFYLETALNLLESYKFALCVGHAETLVFDILKVEWSVASISSQSSITSNKVDNRKIPFDIYLPFIFFNRYLLKLSCCLVICLVQGYSLVLLQHKDKDFLVAFGGTKKDPSNQVRASSFRCVVHIFI